MRSAVKEFKVQELNGNAVVHTQAHINKPESINLPSFQFVLQKEQQIISTKTRHQRLKFSLIIQYNTKFILIPIPLLAEHFTAFGKLQWGGKTWRACTALVKIMLKSKKNTFQSWIIMFCFQKFPLFAAHIATLQ